MPGVVLAPAMLIVAVWSVATEAAAAFAHLHKVDVEIAAPVVTSPPLS